MIEPLTLKVNDLQPYFYGQVKDDAGAVVDITGATIRATMKNASTGTLKIDRQTTGISITDAANGKFQYVWQSGDTNTVGKYHIEFEVSPLGSGKFTVPTEEKAVVYIVDSLDTT